MIYTKMTKLAMKIAYDAHHGRLDKSGVPYIFHPIHLAESMETENETIVALLHDVMEDTSVDYITLKSYGFSDAVLDALLLLTHDKSVEYMDYIHMIKNNVIARNVKLADLRHNCDSSRLDEVDSKSLARVEKYEKAVKILTKVSKCSD